MEYSDILNKTNSLISRSVQKAVLCIKDVDLDRYADNNTNELAKAALQLQKAYRSTGLSDITLKSTGYKMIKVQFNPQELTFKSQPQTNGKKNGSLSDDKTYAVQTIMGVKLIYEDIKAEDAFIWEKQNTLMSGSTKERLMASSIGMAVSDRSVKKQIDGLLSLLMTPAARNIAFCWENTIISGVLQSAEAQYTMFSTAGNPIMGYIDLKIAMHNGNDGSVDKKYWNKAFDNLFTLKNRNVIENVTNTIGTVNKLMEFNR